MKTCYLLTCYLFLQGCVEGNAHLLAIGTRLCGKPQVGMAFNDTEDGADS